MPKILEKPSANGCLLAMLAVWLVSWPLVADARTHGLVLNSLKLSAAACGLAWPASVALAALLARTDLPGRRPLALVLGGMMFVPLYFQAAAWQAAFDVEGWFVLRGGSPREGWGAAAWVHAWAAIPWMTLIAGLGFSQVEPHIEEMALLEGTAWQAFWRVTCRLAAVPLAAAALWAGLAVAGEMTITDLFRVRTFAEEIYTELAVEPSEPLRLAPQIAFLAALCLAALLVLDGWSRALGVSRPRAPRLWPLGPWRWPAAAGACLAIGIVVGLPLASLAWKTGLNVALAGDERLRTWSAGKFCERLVACPWSNRREFGWSLSIAALAATIAALGGGWLAWQARRGVAWAWPALAGAAAAWAVPGPLVGLAVIRVFNQPDRPWLHWAYDRTLAPVVVVQAWKALGATIPILWFALRKVPRDLHDLAAVDGLGVWQRWRRLAWLPRRSAWGVAWLAGFALAIGDLPATYLVRPPLVETVPTLVWSRLHTGVDDETSAICLVQWLACQALVAAVAWLVARQPRP